MWVLSFKMGSEVGGDTDIHWKSVLIPPVPPWRFNMVWWWEPRWGDSTFSGGAGELACSFSSAKCLDSLVGQRRIFMELQLRESQLPWLRVHGCHHASVSADLKVTEASCTIPSHTLEMQIYTLTTDASNDIVFLPQCLIAKDITSLCVSLKRKDFFPSHWLWFLSHYLNPLYPFHRKLKAVDRLSLPVACQALPLTPTLPHFLRVSGWDLMRLPQGQGLGTFWLSQRLWPADHPHEPAISWMISSPFHVTLQCPGTQTFWPSRVQYPVAQ